MKTCDLVFTLKCSDSSSIWSKEEHEPLIFGLTLPLLSVSPWRFKDTVLVDRLDKSLSGLPAGSWGAAGCLLREFFEKARRMESLPEGVVRRMLL